MRFLITGGAGFIGANLTRELLAHGHSVSVIDDLSTGFSANLDGLDVEFTHGSILDLDLLTDMIGEVDGVMHLAARSSVPRSLDNPMASHDVNATGTLNVLEASRAVGGKYVAISSSSSVYGANPELPKREAAATRPMSPYAASKLAAESYTIAYGTSFGIPTLAFRFFNVFGPLQAAGHVYAAVIPAFVDAALRGAPLTVHGDGTQSRDFTHVRTVCATLRYALENQVASPDPVNLAFGSRISLNDVLGLIADELDVPLIVEHVASRVGDVPHSQADGSLLRSLIPEIEPVEFSAGLRETIEWMRTVSQPESSQTEVDLTAVPSTRLAN